METSRPKIGIGVIIRKDGKVLLGKRRGSHGKNTWAFPGGHLEMSESIEDCARREVMEETGIKIKNLQKGIFTNDIFSPDKHYVTLFMVSDYDSGEVQTLEPEKCEGWEWFAWDNLPTPLFLSLENLMKEDFDPFKI